MDWAKIAEFAFSCIVAVGGIGAVFTGVVKWSSDIIADRLSRKYQIQLEKEKEKYKTELSRKEYISKTRFEAEFSMYKELSEKNISMVYCVGEATVITRWAPCPDDEITDVMQRLCDQINAAELANKRYAPFIQEVFFDKYCMLEKQATEIFRLFKAWKQYRDGEQFAFVIGENLYHNQEEVQEAIGTKQKALSNNSDNLLKELREHLRTLDVLE